MGKQKRSGSLLCRAIAFLALLTAVDMWANHHFGIGIKRPGALAAIGTAWTAAFAVLDKLFEKKEQKFIRRWLRHIFRVVLSYPVLAIGYFVFVIFALSCSTVRVTFDPEISDLKATLIPADSNSLNKGEKIAPGLIRFNVTANPLGRVFYLKVVGYMPETLTVYPLRGLSINAEKDLRVNPTVLLRPTPEGLRELEDGGKIVISLVKDTNSHDVIATCKQYRGSFLIGTRKRIPSERFDRWLLDVEVMDLKGPARARTLVEWSEPKMLGTDLEIEPGQRLEAEIKTKHGATKERIEFTVENERFIDVLLERIEE